MILYLASYCSFVPQGFEVLGSDTEYFVQYTFHVRF
jgi:hypothetical protein